MAPPVEWIVTGAAGFIGCNAVASFLERGDDVVGIDDLSRPGAERNLDWLQGLGGNFTFARRDVRDAAALGEVFAEHDGASAVLHLAGQVAVTTSIRDPRADFQTNAVGTFNVCEATRLHVPGAVLINASTNKVYGARADEGVGLVDGRWWSASHPQGIDETAPLDFHSPYACSKGAGDQYVLDYARTYGLRTVTLRQSCIYGPRQFGIEDQGWVAWLTAAALAGRPFTIYGDGRQVRDLLFVDDLVALYSACSAEPETVAGRALNVGGGPSNALSLLQLVSFLEARLGRPVEYEQAPPRSGDQRFFVADTRAVAELLGWRPGVDVASGLERLTGWIEANLEHVLAAVDRRQAETAHPSRG
jgi:CDP-paratose 2-epimerase